MLGWHQLGSMKLPTGFMSLHAEDLLDCTMKLSYRPQAATRNSQYRHLHALQAEL